MGLGKYIVIHILILFIFFSGCVDNTKMDEPNTIISQNETIKIVESVDNNKQLESCIPTFVKNESFEITKISGGGFTSLGTKEQREAEIQLFEETGKTFINKNQIDYLNLSNSTKNKLLGIGFIKIIGTNSKTKDICDISVLNLELNEDNIVVKPLRNDIKFLMVGESWNLKYGWVLTTSSIDAVGNTVWITLSKDGIRKDDYVVRTGETYNYQQDKDITITTHLENTIRGETTSWAGLTNTTLNHEQILIN